MAEDVDIRRLKEESREEDLRNVSQYHVGDDSEEEHRRSPFATSYNRLLDNSGSNNTQWVPPVPPRRFGEQGTAV